MSKWKQFHANVTTKIVVVADKGAAREINPKKIVSLYRKTPTFRKLLIWKSNLFQEDSSEEPSYSSTTATNLSAAAMYTTKDITRLNLLKDWKIFRIK